jgi:hypothetical protein
MYGNSNEWDLYLRPVSHDKYVIAISHCKHGRRMMTKQNKTKILRTCTVVVLIVRSSVHHRLESLRNLNESQRGPEEHTESTNIFPST